MIMRTVQKNLFLILNSVPVTSVTDPELIRPFIPVMTHSLDQKVVARRAKARMCEAEVAENVQAKVERQNRLLNFFVIPPSRSIPQRYTKLCVICPHNSAGMVSFMWCQIVKLSPAPNDTSAQSERKLFYIDSFSRTYGIQKLLRCREILECVQNLISPVSLLFAIRRSACTTFSRRGLFEESKLFQNRMMHLN